MLWTLLIITLGTDNTTARMRAWRALKALGAAVLRDGVYLLPARDDLTTALHAVAADVRVSGGAAWLLQASGADDELFARLFDRRVDYGELIASVASLRTGLTLASAADAVKQARKLRKAHAQLVAIDFFAGEAQRQADAALGDLELAAQRLIAPDEPHAVERSLPRLDIADVQGRSWATRARPWVDRLACAWLIRRCIDPGARLLWLSDIADCPADALGYDYDGATFAHVGARVSFETLLASFGLESAPLLRLGALVHFLDVGGVQPAEAGGVERVLAGLRQSISDDDQLLASASAVFDGLLAAFAHEPASS
jgi:hypothetical protein